MLEVTLQKIIGYSLHINQICIKIKQSFFALQVTAFFINTASTCTVSKLQHSNVLCQKKLSRPNPLTSSWSFSALVRIVVMCYNSLSNRKIWSGLRCERLITYKMYRYRVSGTKCEKTICAGKYFCLSWEMSTKATAYSPLTWLWSVFMHHQQHTLDALKIVSTSP